MTAVEREHITKALQFELSKCGTRDVRVRMLSHLQQINTALAAQVARELGEVVPGSRPTVMPPGTADSAAETALLATATSPTTASGGLQRAKGLSLVEGQPGSAQGRQVAILAADGVNAGQVDALVRALAAAGAKGVVVGPHLGALGGGVQATATLANTASVLFDAVFVPGGAPSVRTLVQQGDARVFLAEAYKHAKPIGAVAEGVELVTASPVGPAIGRTGGTAGASDLTATAVQTLSEVGRVQEVTAGGTSGQQLASLGLLLGQGAAAGGVIAQFVAALAQHRFWGRPQLEQTPA